MLHEVVVALVIAVGAAGRVLRVGNHQQIEILVVLDLTELHARTQF